MDISHHVFNVLQYPVIKESFILLSYNVHSMTTQTMESKYAGQCMCGLKWDKGAIIYGLNQHNSVQLRWCTNKDCNLKPVTTTTTTTPEPKVLDIEPAGDTNSFAMMDYMDSRQIAAADSSVKDMMVYKVQGKTTLSYAAIKAMALEMSLQGHSLEIKSHCATLRKDDPEDRKTWVWQADVVMINKATGHETLGTAENPFNEERSTRAGLEVIDKYDKMGRTKAISKASRNAIRQQIPELRIIEFCNNILKEAEK